MSSHLWKFYLEDDVDRFRYLLETATYHVRPSAAQKGAGGGQSMATQMSSSPATHGGMSPMLGPKGKRTPAREISTPGSANAVTLTRADINWPDAQGLTILHHAASSVSENAIAFAQALLDHPLVDLYLQDMESGWTALHRAFYFGNIAIARAILERDAHNSFGRASSGKTHRVLGLIKIKDREGLGPLDLYAATIQDRTLHPDVRGREGPDFAATETDITESAKDETPHRRSRRHSRSLVGDECFTFGSNRNITLGFGDEDDRQWPERITLKRPPHLLQGFYREHMASINRASHSRESDYLDQAESHGTHNVPVESMPWVVQSRPIKIEDVFMSKLHTAVLTDDPEANLHVCGHGPGGRLGLGHEKSQFTMACVEGGGLIGKKIVSVGLGLNHTLAISDDGEIFSWGSNVFGQLGYTLPKSGISDDEPVQVTPRQIFGPLKREIVHGVAASRIHSAAYAGNSLYTWGKNEGQLGLVDSDARSLEVQVTPRKVGASLFSTPIAAISAIDRATICLLSGSHDCWVFANYGYAKVQFPTNSFQNYFLNEKMWTSQADSWQNHVVKITSGGDSICAMSSNGEVYSLSVSQPQGAQTANASTTNPGKIKAALSQPQRIWSLKKHNMAARDVGVDADGSIIITTEEGSVWNRSRRAKIKDATASGTADYKPKDYKFSRISGLTRVIGVRASSYGAYAAIRRDCDVTRTQIAVEAEGLWRDFLSLLSFKDFQTVAMTPDSESETPQPRFWLNKHTDETAVLKKHLFESKDLESELKQHLYRIGQPPEEGYDVMLGTTVSDLMIPAHQALLRARSQFLRDNLNPSMGGLDADDSNSIKIDNTGAGLTITFVGLDPLTLITLVLYLYTDHVIDYWHYASRAPKMAHRYRTIRTELMKTASHLGMKQLEVSVRQMITPERSMHEDFDVAFHDPSYFETADILVELAGDEEVPVHSTVVCSRCPFFEGMFMGRAGGRWLEDRRSTDRSDLIKVDLKHIDSTIFKIVLRHIYADSGEELFDEVVSADLEEFFDTVMEVLSVANELMLDRLAQICQKVMGRYVSIRNVASLLNAVAPSSVSEFKDASLEYMCLSLESMLHGGLLDELDEDLLYDLDETVRANQLACMPFAKSGRAEALLMENHPELVDLLERNRQFKIDSITIHHKHSDIDNWASNSFRAHGLDVDHASPSQQKSRRRSKGGPTSRQSPAVKGKEAVDKLGTTYDEAIDLDLDLGAPAIHVEHDKHRYTYRESDTDSPPQEAWLDSRGKALSPPASSPNFGRLATSPSPSPSPLQTPTGPAGVPWTASPAGVKKLDMRDIMAQASSSRVSSLSAEIAASKVKLDPVPAATAVKMSQKERKKMQQQQVAAQLQAQRQASVPNDSGLRRGTPPAKASAWQTVGSATKVPSLKDVLHSESQPPVTPAISNPANSRKASAPQLTMRQTVANAKPVSPGSVPKSSAPTASSMPKSLPILSPRPTATKSATPPATSIRSVRHQPRPVEPSIQLSMADILDQQQTEKDIIAKVKEENAKRSLQDIQAEQEFQEWWEKEERRFKIEAGLLPPDEEEEDESAMAKNASKRGGKSGRGGRGRGGKAVGERRASGQQAPDGGEKGKVGADRAERKDRAGGGRAKSGAQRGRGGPAGLSSV